MSHRRILRLFLGRERDLEREVDEEIEAHLSMRAQELERRGLAPAEARAEAERRLGGLDQARRKLRASARERTTRRSRRDFLASLRADVSLAMRRAAKAPVQTLTGLATLALAIGLTTAGFTVVDRVLIRPLPFEGSDRLITLQSTDSTGAPIPYLSEQIWLDWAERARSLESTALYGFATERLSFAGSDGARNVSGVEVTAGFFQVLRVPMLTGRAFVAGDADEDVAVVSETFWRRDLASAPLPLGADLAGSRTRVVGVVPAGLEYPPGTEVYRPFRPVRRSGEAYNWLNHFGMARLADGVDRETAAEELGAVARASREDNPEAMYLHGALPISLREHVVGDARSYLLLLMGAVSVLLLIACANLAGLGVARASARGPEVALRRSLGAGRGRLIRQFLTEHLLLALAGGALGVALAAGLTDVLAERAAGALPRATEIELDPRVLGFALVLSVGTGVLSGCVPALWASRASLREGLGSGRGAARAGKRSPASLLVGVEVALALVLLTGGGLLLRSFQELLDRRLGFDVEGIVTADIVLGGHYPAGEWSRFWSELGDRLASRPGVRSVGFSNAIPTGIGGTGFIQVEGLSDTRAGASYRVVSDDYFEALGIARLAGRTFSAEDQRDTPRATVINRAMAERYWRDGSPLGRQVKAYSMEGTDGTAATAPWLTVVGVVESIRHAGHIGDEEPEMYVSVRQAVQPWFLSAMTAVVRGQPGVPAASLAAPVREALRERDPRLAAEIRTLDERVSGLLAQRRTVLLVLSGFATISLLLAALGLYGLLAFTVAQSLPEMGIRSALGARRGGIVRLVLGRALRVVAYGAVAGALGAFWATRLLESLLVDVAPRDPTAFGAAVAVLFVVATAAALAPARRAASVDPVEVLRAS